jgi:hypothetical protein
MSEENDPAGQRSHDEDPVVLPYFPVSHFEHTVELIDTEYIPSPQGMHDPFAVRTLNDDTMNALSEEMFETSVDMVY